jgi:ABC-type branched-subunit amino acid transport system permease subunit
MPMVQEFWKKLNANEKMVMYGAIIIVIAFVVGLVGSYGFGSASTDLVGAIAVAVIYWLKYSPNKITWPAPVETIVLVISGIAAIFAVLAILPAIALLFSFGLFGISLLINAVGCVVMAWFAYKEYQAMPKATPPPAPPAA